ncbi:MAG TPA: sigma-70 family RNA polymerase sigma factor [Actinophytocola sp.]|nr:sigma-70 family RNA polymerase sigma factor [Actinophytocola sp.]
MSEPWRDDDDDDDAPEDVVLIDAVRHGDTAAYGALYLRHLGAARRAAGALVTSRSERDDLVAESFTKVLRILRAGRGPTDGFRPYLLTTVRNSLINWRQQDSALSLVASVPEAPPDDGRADPVDVRVHADVAAAAFARLPNRWRLVLWYTEIEGRTPAQVAPLLGLTPNSVAALAYRAREGLRRAYLDQHLPEVGRRGCQVTVDQLAGFVRNTLTERRTRTIAAHLEGCACCRDIAADLGGLNEQLPH